MDFFKIQLDRMQKQLAGLSASQKMLTAALIAIMVMTLTWWGRYAGEPEMEALLPQAISADELPRVESELDAKGIKHAMVGDKLMVPADRKLEAVASLMYSHALPRNAKDGFDDVLKSINPFMSERQTSQMWNRGKELTISQIIASFPDVADAHVMIDPTQIVRIGGGVDPSATVTISMRGGAKAPQQLVDAAADVVEGAQSSLPRNKIKVVVDGMPRRLRQDSSENGLFADDQQELIQRAELRLEDKITKQLSYIPGLMVSVAVKLNTTQEVVESKTFDPKLAVSKETETMTKTQETTGGAGGSGGEPGMRANTGLSVNGDTPAAAPAGPSSTVTEETSKFQNFVPTTDSRRSTPAGDATPVAAAVRVPLAYFAAIYLHENPGAKDPTEKQMRGLIDENLIKIRRDVMACTALKQEADIAVETYVDPTPMVAAPQVVTAGISSTLLVGGHIKELVLGILALASLFMVSMVVKKGVPATLVAAPATGGAGSSASTAATAAHMSAILNAGADLAGEAGSPGSTLDGMELDEETVRTQQMLEQVSNLVKENPDSATSLVKRWLNRA